MKSRSESRGGSLIHGDPTCEKCDGTGLVFVLPDGEKFGCASTVAYCECHAKAELDHYLLHCVKLPEKLCKVTVNGYIPNTELQRAARKAITQWVLDYAPDCRGLYLYGPTGTGKTHLACAALRAAAQMHQVSGLYWETPSLIAAARKASRSDEDETVDDLVDSAVEVDVLVLDEYGAGLTGTDFALDVLFRIINGRMSRPTIFTGNLDLSGLQAIDRRIASRIQSCTWLELDGDDYRSKR